MQRIIVCVWVRGMLIHAAGGTKGSEYNVYLDSVLFDLPNYIQASVVDLLPELIASIPARIFRSSYHRISIVRRSFIVSISCPLIFFLLLVRSFQNCRIYCSLT